MERKKISPRLGIFFSLRTQGKSARARVLLLIFRDQLWSRLFGCISEYAGNIVEKNRSRLQNEEEKRFSTDKSRSKIKMYEALINCECMHCLKVKLVETNSELISIIFETLKWHDWAINNARTDEKYLSLFCECLSQFHRE